MKQMTDQTEKPAGHASYCSCPSCSDRPGSQTRVTKPAPPAAATPPPPPATARRVAFAPLEVRYTVPGSVQKLKVVRSQRELNFQRAFCERHGIEIHERRLAPAEIRRSRKSQLAAVGIVGIFAGAIGIGMINRAVHASEPGACQKVVAGYPGSGTLEQWYRDTLIPAAPNGSAVQDALYGAYSYVSKGQMISDGSWIRLHSACAAVGVDIGGL